MPLVFGALQMKSPDICHSRVIKKLRTLNGLSHEMDLAFEDMHCQFKA
jgi:hypothetical protein